MYGNVTREADTWERVERDYEKVRESENREETAAVIERAMNLLSQECSMFSGRASAGREKMRFGFAARTTAGAASCFRRQTSIRTSYARLSA